MTPRSLNTIPPPPKAGTSRTGAVYSIYLTASTGDTVAFTVFEPSTITGGATYPLVLHGHGWSGSRTKTLGSPAASSSEGVSVGTNLSELVYNGYGVISFDQRGFGENTGIVDSMKVTPLRGQGQFDVDLAGVGVRLAPRDQLGILVYGLQDQYARNGAASAAKPAVVPVTVTGTARLPILSSTPPSI